MWRLSFLILAMMAGPAVADLAGDVQRKLDAAAAVLPDSREAALERVLLLHEAEEIVGAALTAGPPRPDLAALVTPEATAARAALRDAAAKDFAPFCEGREPDACLLGEAEALLMQAPEVDRLAEWEGDIGPVLAGRKMAIILAKAGDFSKAEQMTGGITRSIDRNWALRDVALLLAHDGDFPEAFRVLDAIDDPRQLLDALDDLFRWPDPSGEAVVVLTGPKERSAALAAVQRAANLASLHDDAERREQALFEAASLYLGLGEFAPAMALIDPIEDEDRHALWIREMVSKLVETGDFAGAERLVQTIGEGHPWWAFSVRALAVGQAAAGRPAEARRILGWLPESGAPAGGLTEGAVKLADRDPELSAEFLLEAEALAAGIADPEIKVLTLGTIAAAYAETGDSNMAKDVAQRLMVGDVYPDKTSTALMFIASVLENAGEDVAASSILDAAERQAGQIAVQEDRAIALTLLVEGQVKLGQYDEAERVALGIELTKSRLIALGDLGVALARSGEGTEAMRIAGEIGTIEGEASWRDRSLVKVAQALALAGDVTGAEAVVEMIVLPVRRNEALGEVAVGLAEAGRLVDALRIFERLEDPAWGAVALTAVAARL